MNPKTLADILLTLTAAQNFSDSQKYEVIGRFTSGVMSSTGISQLGAIPAAPIAVSAPSPKVEPVPDVMPPGKIVIPKGKQCLCELCDELAYTVVQDVTDAPGIKLAVFFNAFVPPIDSIKGVWPDEDGNVAACCPVCKADYSVWIKGHGAVLYKDIATGSLEGTL